MVAKLFFITLRAGEFLSAQEFKWESHDAQSVVARESVFARAGTRPPGSSRKYAFRSYRVLMYDLESKLTYSFCAIVA